MLPIIRDVRNGSLAFQCKFADVLSMTILLFPVVQMWFIFAGNFV